MGSNNLSEEKIWKAIITIADGFEQLGKLGTDLKSLVDEVAGVSEFPDIDLHELEHDESWRSWKKDEKGACSYPAEEGCAGWIRISKGGNAVLTFVKAMQKRGIQTVSLRLFEYKLSGDDFLQRRPLKKPVEER